VRTHGSSVKQLLYRRLHSPLRDAELGRNVLVSQAITHALEHLLLPLGQERSGLRILPLRGRTAILRTKVEPLRQVRPHARIPLNEGRHFRSAQVDSVWAQTDQVGAPALLHASSKICVRQQPADHQLHASLRHANHLSQELVTRRPCRALCEQ
jgi:hypothetical protein